MERFLSALTAISIIAALVFALLAFGGVEPWAYSVVAVLAYTALAAAVAMAIVTRRARALITPMLVPAALALLLIGAQLIEWPVGLLEAVSPRTVEIHRDAASPAEAGQAASALSPSLYPHATRDALIRLSAYIALFVATCAYVRSRKHIAGLASAIIAIGFAISLFGIVQNISGTRKLYWWREMTYGGALFGPFVSRNQFATYAGVCLFVGLGLLVARGARAAGSVRRRQKGLRRALRASDRMTRGRDGVDWAAGQGAWATAHKESEPTPPKQLRLRRPDAPSLRDTGMQPKTPRPTGLRLGPASAASGRLTVPDPGTSSSPFLASIRPEAQRGSRGILSEALSGHAHQSFLMVYALAVIGAAAIWSLSRGGILSLLLSFAGVLVALRATGFVRSRLLYVGAVAIAILGWVTYLGWEPVLSRLSTLERVARDPLGNWRWMMCSDAVRMGLKFPITGTGAGTFLSAYPLFRTLPTHSVTVSPHNEYVHVFAESGFTGLAVLLLAMALLYGRVIGGLARRKNSYMLGFLTGGIGALLMVSFHSMVDFPMRSPAIAATVAVTAALLYRAAAIKSDGKAKSLAHAKPPPAEDRRSTALEPAEALTG